LYIVVDRWRGIEVDNVRFLCRRMGWG